MYFLLQYLFSRVYLIEFDFLFPNSVYIPVMTKGPLKKFLECGTNNHAMLKIAETTFLSHCDIQFEFNRCS